MLTNSTRRWLAGLGVAGALVAASASPASAEEAGVTLDLYFGDTTIAADSTGKIGYSTLSASEPTVLRDLTVRYDYTGLAGKVALSAEDDATTECTSPEKDVLVCTERWEVGLDEWGLAGIFPVAIAPTDGAANGDSGTLKVTVEAAGVKPVSTEAKVRIGEGVDLAAGPETKVSAAPGGTFTAPLAVTNAGETVAKGASVVFYNDYAIQATKRYSNCTYEGAELRTCQFDEELPAGATFGASLAYALGADTRAPGFAYGEVVWMTPAEFEDFGSYLDSHGVSVGQPGTDGKLTLSAAGAKAAVAARGAQADTEPENNWTSLQVTVTGKNGTDLAAVGDEVTGKAGDTVKAVVGAHNNGPATLDATRPGSSVTLMNLSIPTGTTAVAVPESCFPVNGDEWGEPGQPGARSYTCYFSSFLKAGEEETFEFGLRIDKVVPNATGDVKINFPCQCDAGFRQDLKPANDVAKLVVNPVAGGGAGGGDGDGGTLPITGDSTALVVGIGGVLLAAGAAGFVVARRRRTHFVA